MPGFVLTKPNNHWSEEEKNIYKEYEKKTKDLNEEKDKYKRVLQINQSFLFDVFAIIFDITYLLTLAFVVFEN